jgi:hypothetical protein
MDNATPVYSYVIGDARWNTTKFFAKAFIAMLLLIFAIQFTGAAQVAPPSSNISGPISAVISGHDIILHVKIAHSTPNPDLKYSFENNTSGAVIRKKTPVKYDAATNTLTQEVIVTPGTTVGGFKLALEVGAPNGTAKSSISVSVDKQ